ncbi:DoxX family protein [Nocardia sp. NPDC057353]|uniref:DoxX family protein n=1 Tax=Nocardia sp. NPDC057353 TaxID=3346104 RepID=UPI003632B19A
MQTAWHPLTRIAFRFGVVYFGLYLLLFAQVLYVYAGVVAEWLPDDAVLWQMRLVEVPVAWTGAHVFGVDAALRASGSGDQTAIWVQIFLHLVVAVVAAAAWSVLDRRRPAYPVLFRWFTVLLRLALAGQLLLYGFAKAVPNQMPFPTLTTLITPYGEQQLMDVLWNQVGAAPTYQILLGLAEIAAGLLLVLPRTAVLGALLGAVCMAQVFVLNLTFDVPVKIHSGHLLLIAAVLLLPHLRTLAGVLVLGRPGAPVTPPPLFAARRADRIALAVQLLLVGWLIAGQAQAAADGYREYGNGMPRPALYGIWEVTAFELAGTALPPLRTDPDRWHRLVIDTGGAAYQRMDDTLVPVVATADPEAGTLVLTDPAARAPIARFAVERPAAELLTLRGELGGEAAAIELRQRDPHTFPMYHPPFRWVIDEVRR